MQNQNRYFMKLEGEERGWIFRHEPSFNETETEIKIIDEVSRCPYKETVSKSELLEITEEDYNTIIAETNNGECHEITKKILLKYNR